MISFMDIISPQDNFMDIISPQKSKKSLRIYYIRRNGYNKSAKVEKMDFADIISPQICGYPQGSIYIMIELNGYNISVNGYFAISRSQKICGYPQICGYNKSAKRFAK